MGHTHPTAVNGVLCSVNASALTDGALFPDQIVVCGPHPLFVPYIDPGIPFAVGVRERRLDHVERCGAPPKTIYLQNHGLIALGETADEVLRVHAMAVKAARILLGALSAGGVSFLSPVDADRIESRQDEHYRRAVLAAAARERSVERPDLTWSRSACIYSIESIHFQDCGRRCGSRSTWPAAQQQPQRKE